MQNIPGYSEIVNKFAEIFQGNPKTCGRLNSAGKGWCEKIPPVLEQYARHLDGRTFQDSLGIYPLSEDGTVSFAACDVDNHKGEDAGELAMHAAAVRDWLAEHNITGYIEVSKSGGFHIWIFFIEPVSARDARRLLREGWKQAVGGSIPEIFPKQDRLDNGGFGNFIHLPYYPPSVAQRRRVMTDGGRIVLLEEFLQTVKRHTATELAAALERLPITMDIPAGTTPQGHTFERRPTDGAADLMLRSCRFLQHCELNATSIAYDEWLAALTNIVRAVDGIQAAHDVSAMDQARYKPEDTDKKITEALAMNPQSCAYIRDAIGFQGCPPGGCGVQAPCGWSLSRVAQARAIVRSIPVPAPESVFVPEVLGALAVLKKHDQVEYVKFKATCKGRVNLNDLEKMVKQQRGGQSSHLHMVQPGEPEQDFIGHELNWDGTIASGEETGASSQKVIQANNRFLAMITKEALKALVASNEPPELFTRGGEIVKVVKIQDKDKRNQSFTRPVIKSVNEASLRGYLARSAQYVNAREKNGEVKYSPTSPPLELVRDIMAQDNLPLPLLCGIVQAPVMRYDGSLFVRPGYDTVASLYYAPEHGFSMPSIPETPNWADIKGSLERLVDVVADFPFDTEASRANIIAAIITPVLRDLIAGPVPMLLIDKPLQGTGASLLSDIISIIATGRNSYMTTAPDGREREEEWRKRVTSILTDGRPVVVIDNVEDVFRSATLCALLTSTNWSDRILGRNELVNLQHRTCWIATGNNIRLAGDLPRRCYKVRLDANQAKPWQRDQNKFRHPHLVKYVKENRGALLAAVYTLARAWIIAGRPVPGEVPPMGSFEEWREVIGGILGFAGVSGFLGNSGDIYENAEKNEGIEDFIEVLYQEFGERAVSTKQILHLVTYESKFQEVLPDWLDPGDRGFTRKLGRVLARKAGVIFTNGYKLEKCGVIHQAQLWKVCSVR